MENEVAFLVRFIASGIKVLSARIALFTAMFLNFALYAWVMWIPDYWRLGAAALFSLFIFLPIVGIDKNSKKESNNETATR